MNVFPNKEIANNIQRIGRVSRPYKGKKYAIVYDFIHAHPIFWSQFYSGKNNNRFYAYKDTCFLPDYMEEFIKYGHSYHFNENDSLDKFRILKANKNYALINVEKIKKRHQPRHR